jgi:hypothetical protein
VVAEVMLLNADFGRVMVDRGNVPHQNRLPFSLLLSFGQAKERRGEFGMFHQSLLLKLFWEPDRRIIYFFS